MAVCFLYIYKNTTESNTSIALLAVRYTDLVSPLYHKEQYSSLLCALKDSGRANAEVVRKLLLKVSTAKKAIGHEMTYSI